MKYDIKMLEKLGQTQSIHQYESASQMMNKVGAQADAFKVLKAQNNDLVCLILPDDDDDDE